MTPGSSPSLGRRAKASYGRGPWQLIKWLIDPFALVGVYLALVTLVLDRPGEASGLSVATAVVFHTRARR
jgi:hypothetical protein